MNSLKIVSEALFFLFRSIFFLKNCPWNISVGLRNATTKPIYSELDEKIEKVSKLAYTALVKWTMMGTVLPAFLITGFQYLTSGSRGVTLRLAYPAMYALNTGMNISIELHYLWLSYVRKKFQRLSVQGTYLTGKPLLAT